MLLIVWAVALAAVVLVWLSMRTPWGRVLKSIREDQDAAASLGKNVFAYKLQALALGAALGAAAGLFYAWQFSQPVDHTIFPTTTAPRRNARSWAAACSGVRSCISAAMARCS